MKITKMQLEQLIREELNEMYQPADPREAMRKIRDLADSALSNKSFAFASAGLNPRSTVEAYSQQIIGALKSIRGGGALPGEEWPTDDQGRPMVGSSAPEKEERAPSGRSGDYSPELKQWLRQFDPKKK